MYICTDCGAVFETAKIEKENHPYGMGYATEEYCVCPSCGSTNFSEAEKCELCGEYCAELNEGLCESCYEVDYGE